jgi:uncharacterized membrane protein
MLKKIFFIFFFVTLFLLTPIRIYAQDAPQDTSQIPVSNAENTETLQGRITTITNEKTIEVMGNKQLYQKLAILVTKGSNQGKTLTIENGNLPLVNIIRYKVGDRVTITHNSDENGHDIYLITDFIRSDSLLLLLIIFLVVILFVAKWKGLSSILSLTLTFIIVFKLILPLLANGANPVLVALITSILIIPVTFYLSHGFNNKTTVAILGALASLLITGTLIYIFIDLVHLSGLSSEDAATLSLYKPGLLNMKNILFAGMIIGVLGILDDITAAQASVVQELKTASPEIKKWELYKKAMNVGHDHITSMVNTLILVYSGAALPLLLIFVDNPHPFSEIINYEFLAEEIVRTLVGGIGLVLAVPITTLIAVIIFNKNKHINKIS